MWRGVWTVDPDSGISLLTTDEVTFWGVTGQKLATYQIQVVTGNGSTAPALWMNQTGTNYYFGSKLIKNAGGYVVADRLGSIGKFYPWGQEKPSATTNGTEKFTGYFRDAETGLDYADHRYHSPGTGRFMTPDPYMATASGAADPTNPGSWNRYAYVNGDPINYFDPTGTIAYCVTGDGCTAPPDTDPCFGADSNCYAGGGSEGSDQDAVSPGGGVWGNPQNPCNFNSLGANQQGMLTPGNWVNYSAQQQQLFMDITTDAASIGLSLAGLSVQSITIARQNGNQTELNLSGNVAALIDWLNGVGSGTFTSSAQDPMVGPAHSGFTGNYRQNGMTWSMQVETAVTDVQTGQGNVQIDIDPYNPSDGLFGMFGHGVLQWLPNKITKSDTNPFRTRSALINKGVSVGSPCTGN